MNAYIFYGNGDSEIDPKFIYSILSNSESEAWESLRMNFDDKGGVSLSELKEVLKCRVVRENEVIYIRL